MFYTASSSYSPPIVPFSIRCHIQRNTYDSVQLAIAFHHHRRR
jgi:hypothetical protein